jgi:putative pyruvate formate lyase activating enzyme
MSIQLPAYLRLPRNSSLRDKARQALKGLSNCTLCPRRCSVDRTAGEKGFCRTGANAWVSGYDAHFGEEAPLVGQNGSGTIFFTNCNLGCSFCQNYDISHQGAGFEISIEQLAQMMLELQTAGCHNINLVTPTHVVPHILAALVVAAEKGLRVPLVYNSSGYERVETLRALEGVIDIYMPDFKFWDADIARQTCQAPDYPAVARGALIEMHRQVGDLVLDDKGLARRGLLVRHLVLPNGLAGTGPIMRFIADHLSPRTYVNVMNQYRPCGQAVEFEDLDRCITREEYDLALRQARQAGILRLDQPRRTFVFY